MSALCPLPRCGRPSQDGGVCSQDVWLLRKDLRKIPGLLADLHAAMAHQDRLGPAAEKVGGKGETPVFFGQRAATELRRFDSEIVRCAAVVFGDVDGWSSSWAAGRLLAAVPDLRTRGDAAELWDAIQTAVWRAERAVDAPAMRTIIPIGPCPETGDDGPCGGTVQAFIPADDKPAHMACDGEASHVWSSMQWLRAGKRIRDLAERRARAARMSA